MLRPLVVLCGAVLLTACNVTIPNGVFSCVGPSDCPDGYSCWSSDSRCYDTKEPETVCVSASCEDVIGELGALGIDVECGQLPDGCGGIVECPPCDDGEVCGANGQSFLCGCEQATCNGERAECGELAVGCGLDATVDCGECLGQLRCEDNRCVCPEGEDCDAPCGGCAEGETCVEGQCCTPLFPCADSECSPPGGLPDGCGGFVQCAPCADGSTCEPTQTTHRFECVDDCTCEARGVECGTASFCGQSRLCGVCTDVEAPLCDDGRCVCSDAFEPNQDPSTASLLSCGSACKLGSLLVEEQGTLESAADRDFYELIVPHREEQAFRLDVKGLRSTGELFLGYICPDGSERISDCSGSSSSFESSKYCIDDGANNLRLVQECDDAEGEPATVIVGIGSKQGEFEGPCDKYVFSLTSFPYGD